MSVFLAIVSLLLAFIFKSSKDIFTKETLQGLEGVGIAAL